MLLRRSKREHVRSYRTVYELSYGAALGQLQHAAFGAVQFCDVSATPQQLAYDGHVISSDCAVQRPTHTDIIQHHTSSCRIFQRKRPTFKTGAGRGGGLAHRILEDVQASYSSRIFYRHQPCVWNSERGSHFGDNDEWSDSNPKRMSSGVLGAGRSSYTPVFVVRR